MFAVQLCGPILASLCFRFCRCTQACLHVSARTAFQIRGEPRIQKRRQRTRPWCDPPEVFSLVQLRPCPLPALCRPLLAFLASGAGMTMCGLSAMADDCVLSFINAFCTGAQVEDEEEWGGL